MVPPLWSRSVSWCLQAVLLKACPAGLLSSLASFLVPGSPFFLFSFKNIVCLCMMCACVWGWHVWFPPTACLCVLWSELRPSGLHGKHLYLSSHFSGPFPGAFTSSSPFFSLSSSCFLTLPSLGTSAYSPAMHAPGLP